MVACRKRESGLVVFIGGAAWVGVWKTGVLVDEVGHGQDATHPAGVISEEDSAKGGESAYQVGLEGDGGFET